MFNQIERKLIKSKLVVMTICCLTIIAVVGGSVAAQNGDQRLPVAPNTVFQKNVKYVSESGNHYLIFQDDGNLVVYDKNNGFVWGVNQVSKDFGRATKAEFSMFGVLVLYDAQGRLSGHRQPNHKVVEVSFSR